MNKSRPVLSRNIISKDNHKSVFVCRIIFHKRMHVSQPFKLTAFALGTALAGLAGGLYCYFARFIVPDDFGFITSISVLSMVAVGGIGSVAGVIVGTALLTLMPEFFRFISDYKLLVYGALLFAVMRFAPDGLAGLARRLFVSGRLKGGGP